MRIDLKQLIFLFFLTMLVSCKKYPEGGLVGRSHKNLTTGLSYEYEKQWKLRLYEVNGMDSTAWFKDGHSSDRFSNYEVVISGAMFEKYDFRLETEVKRFKMKLSADKKKLTLTSNDNTYNEAVNCYRTKLCERNIFMPESDKGPTVVWEILRLKKDELIITTLANNSYKIILDYHE